MLQTRTYFVRWANLGGLLLLIGIKIIPVISIVTKFKIAGSVTNATLIKHYIILVFQKLNLSRTVI
jgi:hypothetical protein